MSRKRSKLHEVSFWFVPVTVKVSAPNKRSAVKKAKRKLDRRSSSRLVDNSMTDVNSSTE